MLATLSGFAFEEQPNLSTGVGTTGFCYGPLLLIFTPLPAYAFFKTPEALRALHFADQTTRAMDLIHLQDGEITYAELGGALNLSEREVDRLLSSLIEQQKISGYRAAKRGRFYTASALVAKQERLLSSVALRDFAGSGFKIPPAVTRSVVACPEVLRERVSVPTVEMPRLRSETCPKRSGDDTSPPPCEIQKSRRR